MFEGALILILGMAIGGSIVYFYLQKPFSKPKNEPKEKPYDKYKNKDGLYSRNAIRESR